MMPMPDDLKRRLINGGVNLVTNGLSKLLEKILKPLVPHLGSFIKDEFDFVTKIPRKVQAGVYAVTCDVTSLYTSIPMELGTEAISYWLCKLSNLIPNRFTPRFVIEAIQFVLENNFFSFNGEIWHQCTGTAMGKSFAPPYACLVMGYLEETRLFPCLLPANFDEETTALIIKYFYRYIDDNFNFLPDLVRPDVFLGVLNSMDNAIQYTMTLPAPYEKFSKSNDYLAIRVIINHLGDIKTNVFYKETNAHDYLQFDSHHPHHTKANIPYTLAKRIILLTSDDEWVKQNLSDLRTFLLNRKYPPEVIDRGIHNALLQGPAPKPQKTKTIPLVTTFYSNYDCQKILKVTSDLIQNSKNKRIQNAFEGTKFLQSRRQPKNLLQLLSNSRFITSEGLSDQQKPAGIFHCNHRGCKICKLYLQECKSFLTSNGSSWDVKCHATCNSKNVLYFLICYFCNSTSYTGKTDDFRPRTNDHISKIRKGKSTNQFDIHVHQCAKKAKKATMVEPFFKAYIFMVVSDYNKLLNLERKLHLAGHDTLNN